MKTNLPPSVKIGVGSKYFAQQSNPLKKAFPILQFRINWEQLGAMARKSCSIGPPGIGCPFDP